MAIATDENAAYVIESPQTVGDVSTLFSRLRNGMADQARLLIGFDFPIGVPSAYAQLANIDEFRLALAHFGTGMWQAFYDKCRTAAEISVNRPFYPVSCPTRGAAKREHLTAQLNLSWTELYRECDRKTDDRNAACPLFWTLGGNQVGSAAIAGWKELLTPELQRQDVALGLWPFDGNLPDLVSKYSTVVAETYPAEAYRHLRFPASGWSKRSQSGRRDCVHAVLAWADARPAVRLDNGLRAIIDDGFGPRADGEDPFDAFVGLCSMLDVVLGLRQAGAPTSDDFRKIEGWILGQSSETRSERGSQATPQVLKPIRSND